jgi:hypothetical protein
MLNVIMDRFRIIAVGYPEFEVARVHASGRFEVQGDILERGA